MPSRFSRILVLASALPLALPASWCCMLAVPPRADKPAPAAETPCQCCQALAAAKPAPGHAPRPQPRPSKSADCPCLYRNATPPSGLKTPGLDLAHPAPPAALPVPTLVAGGPEVARPEPAGLSLPRNLLHCVWLC